MKNLRVLAILLIIICALAAGLNIQQSSSSTQNQADGMANLSPELMREWLTYLSSDDLEGRETFSEGLGLAAAYIAEQLKAGGVKPGGDRGLFFQRVGVLGVKSTNRSALTVEVNGQKRTFANGQGITFPPNVGGKQTLTLDSIEFVGYGLNMGQGHNDYKGIDVKGKAVVFLGSRGPRSADPAQVRLFAGSRASSAIQESGAVAAIAPPAAPRDPDSGSGADSGGRGGGGGRGRGSVTPDFTTVQRIDVPVPPSVTASDEFLEFLFGAADMKYADLKAKANSGDALPRFTLKNVKLTFSIDADYQVVQTRYTRNVVGIVEGSDPQLKNTYVAFGAHYDHTGYRQGTLDGGETDRINNGADDDGSGTTTLIGLARAFAQGPKPKRSTVFVWHAGEEIGLWGSEHFADDPVAPVSSIAAQLNMDMIGRNRDNNPSEANSLLVVGSDRISTELHNILIDANASLPKALTLDFEMNDPTDSERIYYRSDHYSYAAKGIPIIFFFTGLHPDYHRVTDSVEKINFEKMSRIGHLVYEVGARVANLDHLPVRDFKGPRMGKGSSGRLAISN